MAGLTNLNPLVIVNCADSQAATSKGLVFDNSDLVVASGTKTLVTFDMSQFFQPCSTFMQQEFWINPLDNLYLEPGNQGELLMIVIDVTYPPGTGDDCAWVNWIYGGQTMKMGRLMILSGGASGSVDSPGEVNSWDLGVSGGLQIQNPQGFPVGIRTLMLNATVGAHGPTGGQLDILDDESNNPILL